MRAVEAESQALKGEAAESTQKEKSLRQELASLKVFHVDTREFAPPSSTSF